MASPSFSMPTTGPSYSAGVVARAQDLINLDIWSGIKPTRLHHWLKNFTSDEEKYLAACILDHLIYRSNDQTLALARHLFARSLMDLVRNDPSIAPLGPWLEKLQDTSEPNIRLVVAVREDDPPHKSAHTVARMLSKKLRIRDQWIIKPWEIRAHLAKGVRTFVFVDDFVGTGHQFIDLIRVENLADVINNHYVVYAPFVAYADGVTAIKSAFPSLRFASAELLGPQHQIFNPDAKCFEGGASAIAEAKKLYEALLTSRGFDRLGEEFGYGDLGIAYAFEHATPDNNLPILWHKWGTWFPLLDR
jgi:hypothetical protein